MSATSAGISNGSRHGHASPKRLPTERSEAASAATSKYGWSRSMWTSRWPTRPVAPRMPIFRLFIPSSRWLCKIHGVRRVDDYIEFEPAEGGPMRRIVLCIMLFVALAPAARAADDPDAIAVRMTTHAETAGLRVTAKPIVTATGATCRAGG